MQQRLRVAAITADVNFNLKNTPGCVGYDFHLIHQWLFTARLITSSGQTKVFKVVVSRLVVLCAYIESQHNRTVYKAGTFQSPVLDDINTDGY